MPKMTVLSSYYSSLMSQEWQLLRAQGWEAGPGQLDKVVGEIRRAMSVTVVHANATCLMKTLPAGTRGWSGSTAATSCSPPGREAKSGEADV